MIVARSFSKADKTTKSLSPTIINGRKRKARRYIKIAKRFFVINYAYYRTAAVHAQLENSRQTSVFTTSEFSRCEFITVSSTPGAKGIVSLKQLALAVSLIKNTYSYYL